MCVCVCVLTGVAGRVGVGLLDARGVARREAAGHLQVAGEEGREARVVEEVEEVERGQDARGDHGALLDHPERDERPSREAGIPDKEEDEDEDTDD